MLPAVKYSVLRVTLFVIALVLIRWAGAGLLTALILAAVVSALVSFVLLRGPREDFSRQIEQKIDSRLERTKGGRVRGHAQDEAIEDAASAAEREPDGKQG